MAIMQLERVRAVYRKGSLKLLEPVTLPEGTEVWVELYSRPMTPSAQDSELIEPINLIRPQPAESLSQLVDLVAVGGNALADAEALDEADWN
jgi:predicted DNA-binding antitoxin AbrB/MazE fold protein